MDKELPKFKDDQLLDLFLECLDNINFSLKHEDNFKRNQAHLAAAPAAYEVYNRFYAGRKYFSHPSLKSEHLPNTIQFWTDPVAISLLHQTLVKDGFYKKM